MKGSSRALIAIALTAWAAPAFAERETRTAKPVVACTSWAAWREFGQASLTARGARMSKHCPVRLAAGAKVVVVDEDAGAGASEIRFRGRIWFVDAQRLD
jgi:hypothetical protein